MSKPINPVAIGGFTVGALALLVAGLLIFGGGQLFSNNKVRFVIFFDSSLNGLDVGAPVKMQGVKIGSVKEIVLQFDMKSGKVYKPVVVELDRESFVGGSQDFNKLVSRAEQKSNRDKLVASGFRARLEMQSLLTGLLYIDFDRHPDEQAVYVGLEYNELLELPAIPTTADQLRNAANDIAKKISALPLEEIIRDAAASMKDIRDILASEETQKSRAALTKTLEGAQETVTMLNRTLEPLLKDSAKTVSNTNALVNDSRKMVEDVHKDIGPVLAAADKALTAATAALNKADNTLTDVGDVLGPDSALNSTLQSINNAARSIRDLSDYLERHPDAVLSGKEQ
ncbi:MAG: MlaD family protein [Methylococcaceae bacterium]